MNQEAGEFVTVSESLFAAICRREGYAPHKIPQLETQTADFRVSTSHGEIFAEVKGLNPNAAERDLIRRSANGEIVVWGGTIGARAHDAIKEAAAQLKQHADENRPSLIVLYSNVTESIVNLHLNPVDIDVAMNGQWTTWSRLGRNGGPLPPDFNGGKKTLTSREKRYISAVAVISNLGQERFYIYHNAFAAHPLPKGLFVHPECFHYKKPGEAHETPSQWECFSNSTE